MDLREFLVFFSGVGVVAGVSWVFEYFKLLEKAEPKQKQLIFFAVCIGVALLSYCALTFVPAEVLDKITPFFQVVSAIFIYQFLGETYHKTTKLQ
jgi:hypothetical protein